MGTWQDPWSVEVSRLQKSQPSGPLRLYPRQYGELMQFWVNVCGLYYHSPIKTPVPQIHDHGKDFPQ